MRFLSVPFGILLVALLHSPLIADPVNLGLMSSKYSRPDVAFFPDGKRFAVASDKTVRIFDLTGKPLRTLQSYLVVKGLAISPDGTMLATAESDDGGNVSGLVKVVDPSNGRVLRQFRHRAGYAEWLAFSPDGQFLASVGDEEAVYVWNVRTGKPVARITGHAWGNLSAVCFSADGKYLYSGGQYRDNEALLKAKAVEDKYYNRQMSRAEAEQLEAEIEKWYSKFAEGWKIGELFVYSTDTWTISKRIATPGAVQAIENIPEEEGAILAATGYTPREAKDQDGKLLKMQIQQGPMEALENLPPTPDDFAGLMEEHRFYYRQNTVRMSSSGRYALSDMDGIEVFDEDGDSIYSESIDAETVQSPAPVAIAPDGKTIIILKYNRQTGLGTADIVSLD